MATLTKLDKALTTVYSRIDGLRRGLDEKTSNIRTRLANVEEAVVDWRSFTTVAAYALLAVIGIVGLSHACHVNRAKGWDQTYEDQANSIRNLEAHAHNQMLEIRELQTETSLLTAHGRITNSDGIEGSRFSLERRESGAVFWRLRGQRMREDGIFTQDAYLRLLDTAQKRARNCCVDGLSCPCQ